MYIYCIHTAKYRKALRSQFSLSVRYEQSVEAALAVLGQRALSTFEFLDSSGDRFPQFLRKAAATSRALSLSLRVCFYGTVDFSYVQLLQFIRSLEGSVAAFSKTSELLRLCPV